MRSIGVAASVLCLSSPALAAVTPVQKCEMLKNKAAGKYAACRHVAVSKKISSGDDAKYVEALLGCESKLAALWQKGDLKGDGACAEAPLARDDFQSVIDDWTANVSSGLAGDGLRDYEIELATCSDDLFACQEDLQFCEAAVDAMGDALAACEAEYSSATASLTACNDDLSLCQGSRTLAYHEEGTPTLEITTATGPEVYKFLGAGVGQYLVELDPGDNDVSDISDVVTMTIVSRPAPNAGALLGAPNHPGCTINTSSQVRCARAQLTNMNFATDVSGDYVIRFERDGAKTLQLVVHAL